MTATPNLEAHNPVLLANGSRRRLVGRLTAEFIFSCVLFFRGELLIHLRVANWPRRPA